MASKFIAALKCFFKSPVYSARLMLGSSESRVVESIKARCPEVDIESLGYYAGLFMAILFVILCVIMYLFFYALKVITMYREMIFPP
ncbi:MAG: hypothetical protein IBX41_08415 [Methanophagales archaeon]|nr:hypothetical protein [Methanophagales archaeon]